MAAEQPGGSISKIPPRERGAHSPTSAQIERDFIAAFTPPVFGEVLPKRSGHSKLRDQVRETVVPAGLLPEDPIQNPEPTQKKPLSVGDSVRLYPGIITFEEADAGGRFHEADVLREAGDFQLTNILKGNHKPIFTFERKREDGSSEKINIKPMGHGKGWVRVEKNS